MQDITFNTYDAPGYDEPEVPYIPYVLTSFTAAYRPLSASEQRSIVSGNSSVDSSMAFLVDAPAPGQFIDEIRPATARKPRNRWVVPVSVIAILLVLSGAAYGVYSLMSYTNRSTPMKTLDAFCTALQTEDYNGAYNLFSENLQKQFSESSFAGYIAPDKIVSCTHGVANEGGGSTKTNLKLIHDSKGVNDDMVFLKKDGTNNWKIDDLQQATAAISSSTS